MKFNPDNKDKLSPAEACGPAMLITEQAEADQYLADYGAFLQHRLEETGADDMFDGIDLARSALLTYAEGEYATDFSLQHRIKTLFNRRAVYS